jgi:hypothetical protein
MSSPYARQRPRAVVRLLVLASLCAAGAAPALGQDYVRPPCEASTAPRFEDHLQSLWYRRFWTGECKDLPVFGCRSGRPYWNEVVQTIVARAPADKRSDAVARVCRLGSRVGFEWTRPKRERRIDTNDLQSLYAKLNRAPDVMAGLGAVEASVKAKLGS